MLKGTKKQEHIRLILDEIGLLNEELQYELYKIGQSDYDIESEIVFDFVKKILKNKKLKDEKNIMTFIDIQFRFIRIHKLLSGIL